MCEGQTPCPLKGVPEWVYEVFLNKEGSFDHLI